MKRTLMALIQLTVIGALALAGLLMTITFISTVLKIFAFILGEWIYTALILFVGALFILIPVGYAVSVLLKHIEHSNKEYESSHAREYRLRKEAAEKKKEQD